MCHIPDPAPREGVRAPSTERPGYGAMRAAQYRRPEAFRLDDPRVTVRGGWWQRQRIGRRVTRLWRLARGEAPILTSPAALNRWLRELEELKTALANGTIQLT